MRINFSTRSETKISPTKAPNVPKAFFVGKVKKIKGPWDKIAHQG